MYMVSVMLCFVFVWWGFISSHMLHACFIRTSYAQIYDWYRRVLKQFSIVSNEQILTHLSNSIWTLWYSGVKFSIDFSASRLYHCFCTLPNFCVLFFLYNVLLNFFYIQSTIIIFCRRNSDSVSVLVLLSKYLTCTLIKICSKMMKY